MPPRACCSAVALAESGAGCDRCARRRQALAVDRDLGPGQLLPRHPRSEALRKVERAACRRPLATSTSAACRSISAITATPSRSLDEALRAAPATSPMARASSSSCALETRSWARATARYHSRDPDRGQAYRARVYRLWQEPAPRRQAPASAPMRLAERDARGRPRWTGSRGALPPTAAGRATPRAHGSIVAVVARPAGASGRSASPVLRGRCRAAQRRRSPDAVATRRRGSCKASTRRQARVGAAIHVDHRAPPGRDQTVADDRRDQSRPRAEGGRAAT